MKKRSRAIIVAGYVGLSGTAKLAEHYGDKIDAHYPAYLSRNIKEYARHHEMLGDRIRETISEFLQANSENDEEHLSLTIDGSSFLNAMWDFAKLAGEGFTVDLRKIPIKQETIEICELLEVNPYRLQSSKTTVALVYDSLQLCEIFESQGIPYAIIGYTNSSKAHILMNDGTESHLNRPEPDELERLGLI